ncbi:hypothetical protein N9L06_07295, partial [Mariniblastus sp.]|nr:hypothetical protein [Mariniblastus sp.]
MGRFAYIFQTQTGVNSRHRVRARWYPIQPYESIAGFQRLASGGGNRYDFKGKAVMTPAREHDDRSSSPNG